MRARRFLLPLAVLLSVSIPVASLLASPSGGEWIESHKLTASDGTAIDHFGNSVAISGNTAIVGANSDNHAGANAGSAYLFDVTTGNQLFKLTANDATAEEYFGTSVDISGDAAIVGAYWEVNAGSISGSAYLFDVTTGNQLLKLTASDAAHLDHFGYSVAISGNTAIIGALGDDDAGSLSGSAYLFDMTTGSQLLKLAANDATAEDYFGVSVAISGNTAIVGASGDDDAGSRSGSAYLFDVTTGNQLFKLTASDAGDAKRFGKSVAISGNTAIVGSHWNSDAGSKSGSAYLFDVTTGNQLFKLTASDAAEYDEFGLSVGIWDDMAIVGAGWNDDAGTDSGSAYLFDVTTGNQLTKLTAKDSAEFDYFGYSVDIGGNAAIVGAYRDDDAGSDAGSAYIFVPEPSNFILLATGALGLLACGWRKRRS